jgi:ABC-type transport system substrate-binding protein
MRVGARTRLARLAGAIALAIVPTALAGCGGDGSDDAVGAIAAAGSSGALTWAIPAEPTQIDPLLAASRSDQLVARQIYEPLIADVRAPFGEAARSPGLATVRPVEGSRVWRLKLRHGVLFQDGTPFNAQAVLANVERWRALPAGRSLLPGLSEAVTKGPDQVRLVFTRPVPDLERRLASPRLGIVAPETLRHAGKGDEPITGQGVGTGPFELRSHSPERALVTRNLTWWGTAQGLGPALDAVEFRVVKGAGERYRLLHTGEIQVAEDLSGRQLEAVRRDPLLTSRSSGDGSALGLERSVRGVGPATQIPSLSGVWLTRITAG